MKNLAEYINEQTKGDLALRRRITADIERSGVVVSAADANDSYRKTIDQLLAKMRMKRAPIEGRVPVSYDAKVGDHDRKVLAGIDPVDGGKLEKVFISDTREAMYNPVSHAVWPLPIARGEAVVL